MQRPVTNWKTEQLYSGNGSMTVSKEKQVPVICVIKQNISFHLK